MATFRKRGPYQWQAQVRKKGYPLQTRTFDTRAAAETWARAIEVEMDLGLFVSRAEAESTTLKELLERYREEVTPLKKGAAPEAARIRALLRHPLTQRFVASIRGGDIARYRDDRLKKVLPATVKRDLVILSHLFEIARKEWGIHVHNPVRDIKLPPHSKARERRLQPITIYLKRCIFCGSSTSIRFPVRNTYHVHHSLLFTMDVQMPIVNTGHLLDEGMA